MLRRPTISTRTDTLFPYTPRFRSLARLESPYPLFDGINLTWETLEGLAKHNGPVANPGWALAEIDDDFGLDLASHASLEAQVAAIADDIAYDNHDIDDGLRAGLLDLDQLMEQPFVAANYRAVEGGTEEQPSALQSPMSIFSAVLLLKKKK